MAAVVGLSSVVNERPFPLNPPPDSGKGIPDASLRSAFSRCCILTPSGHWTLLCHEMQAGELGRGFNGQGCFQTAQPVCRGVLLQMHSAVHNTEPPGRN